MRAGALIVISGLSGLFGAAGLWSCSEPACGDGRLQFDEECDDGNTAAGDGCSAACRWEYVELCGNDLIDPGEECDDGNRDHGDGCGSTCLLECGNQRLDPGEECEYTLTPTDCDIDCRRSDGADGDADADAPCDECEREGLTRCEGEDVARRCVVDLDGCLRWELRQCDFGCLPEPDVCYEGCTSNCEAGASPVCAGPSAVQRCLERAPSCFRWTRRDCPSGVVCFEDPEGCWGEG